MKIANLILSGLFIIFALVQYNDPDPWLWITLYGYVAVISGLAAFGQYYKWPILLGIACCVIGLLMLLPDFVNWLNNGAASITGSMKAEAPHIELTREFLGLGMVLATLVWHYRKGRAYF